MTGEMLADLVEEDWTVQVISLPRNCLPGSSPLSGWHCSRNRCCQVWRPPPRPRKLRSRSTRHWWNSVTRFAAQIHSLAKAPRVYWCFPSVYKAGFVLGGEYGTGALRIGGQTVDYYNTVGASFGFQIGAQSKTIVIAFMQQQALDTFRSSMGWEAGVDGSIAVIQVGVGASPSTRPTSGIRSSDSCSVTRG